MNVNIQPRLGYEGALQVLCAVRDDSLQELGQDLRVQMIYEGKQSDMMMCSFGNYVPAMSLLESLDAIVRTTSALGYLMKALRASVSRFERTFCAIANVDPDIDDNTPQQAFPGEFDPNLIRSPAGRSLCAAAYDAYSTKNELNQLYLHAADRHSFTVGDVGTNVLRHSQLQDISELHRSLLIDLCLAMDAVVDLVRMFEGAVDSEVVTSAARYSKALCNQLACVSKEIGLDAAPALTYSTAATACMSVYATVGFVEFATSLLSSVFYFTRYPEDDPEEIISPRLVAWECSNKDTFAGRSLGHITANNVLCYGEWILSNNWGPDEKDVSLDSRVRMTSAQSTVSGSFDASNRNRSQPSTGLGCVGADGPSAPQGKPDVPVPQGPIGPDATATKRKPSRSGSGVSK